MITSVRNRRITQAGKLKKRAFRDREARFLVEGAQVAVEALLAGRLETLFHVPDEHGRADPFVERAGVEGVDTQVVTREVMDHLTSTVTPQGVVGVAPFIDVPLSALGPRPMLVAVLCSVRDPGNAGTVLRSADAAGADAVVFGEGSVDVYNPKTVRASAGSLFHLPIVRDAPVGDAVAALRERGAQILAASGDAERSIYEVDLGAPTALLFGNEAWGLPSDVRELADVGVRVPIQGRAESLNLAAAAAVVLFESVRAREAGGGSPEIAELLSAAGHDIRSPLTALTGFVSTLARNWDRFPDDQRLGIIEGMALDGQRANATLRLVVDAARILTGVPLHGAAEPRDVAAAARWVVELMGGSPDAPEVEVEGEGAARCDPDRLRALLLSLVDGAVWWAAEGPVRVRISQEDGASLTEVSRAGEGPSADEAGALLSSPERGGKVALYAARVVAERLGGSLDAEGGGGVLFRLRLPA